jgi:oxygen-independent coproporphyrinogen-3 oxidase
MCNLRVDLATITRDFDQPNGQFASDLARLAPMVEDGFLSIDGDILQIEERGRPLIRCVAAAFDAYLENSKARHSRAV